MRADIQQTTCDGCGAVNSYDPKSFGSTGLRGWFHVEWVPGPNSHESQYLHRWDFCNYACAQKFFNNFYARYQKGSIEDPAMSIDNATAFLNALREATAERMLKDAVATTQVDDHFPDPGKMIQGDVPTIPPKGAHDARY